MSKGTFDKWDILQIMPAPVGLKTVWRDAEAEGGFFIDPTPVVCLALISHSVWEDKGNLIEGRKLSEDKIVSGLIVTEIGIDIPEGSGNFLGYLQEGADAAACAVRWWGEEKKTP